MDDFGILVRKQLLGHNQSDCKGRQLFQWVCIFINLNFCHKACMEILTSIFQSSSKQTLYISKESVAKVLFKARQCAN